MVFGDPPLNNVPLWTAGLAMRSPYGVLHLPPGRRVVAYVRSTGLQSGDDPQLAEKLVLTLAAGLNRCRANMGDVVVVLPGHSESVADATMLDNLKAGTRIIGDGIGSDMPTFRWTATGSQWVLNDANVVIQGLRLRMEGANGVVSAIAVSAADNAIIGCDIETASGATAKATIGIDLAAGAHRFSFCNNVVRGTATHNATDFLLISGVSDGIRICDNEMIASVTAANGLIRVNAAALGLKILRNRIVNTHTSSTAGIAFGAAASSGVVSDNHIGILAASTTTDGTAGIIIGATTICNFFNNYVSDGRNSGSICPTVAT